MEFTEKISFQIFFALLLFFSLLRLQTHSRNALDTNELCVMLLMMVYDVNAQPTFIFFSQSTLWSRLWFVHMLCGSTTFFYS